MNYFKYVAELGHEAVHFFSDPKTGMRAMIGVHSTKLGPSLGGTRALSTYETEEEAVLDVLRLSRGMTYKAGITGLPHGGGKAVIWLPKGSFNRAALFEAFGRAVESLGGRYITTEDSGTSPDDMEHARKYTRFAAGLKEKSGDPSPVTAYGVARGIEAAAKVVLGREDLKGLRVSVLGVGHVGMALVSELHQRGAKLWVSDINKAAVEQAVKQYGATAVADTELHKLDVDVFAPCALGGAINDKTLPMLKVKIVAGAANNQLLEPRHGQELAQRGIVYCPDYAINAGGLINVAQEVAGYDRAKAMARAGEIYGTIEQLLLRSKETGQRPEQIADRMVEEKLERA
jgi:leucine dehydrogenase